MGERSPNETVPSQFRLSKETLGLLDRIAHHFGVTRTDAIRIAARQVGDPLPPAPPKKNPKKQKKTG